jgi:hypothetical protein
MATPREAKLDGLPLEVSGRRPQLVGRSREMSSTWASGSCATTLRLLNDPKADRGDDQLV